MTLRIRVSRLDPSQPWGFRIQGGRDYGEAFIISGISPGGLAERSGLQKGDEVLSIGGDSVTYMSHQQAQQAVIRCGNDLDMEVYRTRLEHPSYVLPARQYPVSRQPCDVFPRSHTRLNINLTRPTTALLTSSPASPPGHSQGGYSWAGANLYPVGAKASPGGRPYTSSTRIRPQTVTKSYVSPSLLHAISPSEARISYAQPVPRQTIEPLLASRRAYVNLESKFTPRNRAPAQSSLYRLQRPASPSAAWHPSQPAASQSSHAPIYAAGELRSGCSGDVRLQPPRGTNKPICYTCHGEIRGPFIDALDYCFCPDHFTCARCRCGLKDQKFVEHLGQFFCLQDFTDHLAPRCAKCLRPIIGTVVKAMNKEWHAECLVCHYCRQSLKDGMFHVDEDNRVLCETHWQQFHHTVCAKCGNILSEIDRFIEAFGKQFHAKCFCCSACQTPLEGKPFHAREGKAFCRAHAHAAAIFA